MRNYEVACPQYLASGRRGIKKLVIAIFSFSLIPYSLFVIQVNAATETELRARLQERNNQIKALEEEIARYQQSLSENRQQSKTLTGEITRLENEIKKLNADITLTGKRIEATELQISELEIEITDKEANIEKNKEVLSEVLKSMYEAEHESTMEVLLKNNKISDFFGDMQQIQNLEVSIQENLFNLKELKASLEDELQSKEEKKNSLVHLHSELDDKKSIQQSTQGKKRTLLSETKNQESVYQHTLKTKEEQRKLVLEEIQRSEDELRKLINPASLPESRTGVLSWPVKGRAVLTQSFGNTPDSRILYNGKPHNGIDIGAASGTSIYAAEGGIVREIGNTDAFPGCLSYGKWILIEHPNNLSTLYAHLSLIKVSRGQSVNRDDLIGYSGATGYATGPHLHFTVYAAKTVEFRSSSVAGSQCRFLPYGGYLNPMAYL